MRPLAPTRPVAPAEGRPEPVPTYDGPLPASSSDDPPWPGRVEVVDLGSPRTSGRDDGPHAMGIYTRATPGPTDAPRMLYVHGLGGASTNWTDLATLLSDTVRGFAIDLPGYGRSDPAPDGDYSISAQARTVIAWIESTGGDPVHLVGNSMGGLVSVEVAATRPELVRTLTLVSPAMPFFRPVSGSDPRMPLLALPGVAGLVERRLAAVDPGVRAQAVIDLVFADPSLVPARRRAEQVTEIEERAGLPWAGSAFTRSLRAIIGSFLRRGSRNPWRLAAAISAPTLVIWGDHDKLVDVRLAPRVAATIPGASLLVVPGVGHTAQLEAPEVTARAVLGHLLAHRDR